MDADGFDSQKAEMRFALALVLVSVGLLFFYSAESTTDQMRSTSRCPSGEDPSHIYHPLAFSRDNNSGHEDAVDEGADT